LFDEIEKADDWLYNILLGVLDKASLSLGDNRMVDFSQAMIFMTSNLGAKEMNEEMNDVLRPNTFTFGFIPPVKETQATGFEARAAKLAKAAQEAMRRKFSPEFINRLDHVVTFQPLGQTMLKDSLEIELGNVQKRIFAAREKDPQAPVVHITFTPEAKDYILAEGTNLAYGARPLKRTLERLAVEPLANLIATAQVRDGDVIRIGYNPASPGALLFQRAEGRRAVLSRRISAA
jgi:ATP-dependent Clp protease ATP-binding subunit ClpB